VIAILLAAAAGVLSSPPAPVPATVEPQMPAAGQASILRIELPGGLSISRTPRLPLANLEVVAGPSIENRFQWINGKSSSQTILTYRLRALAPGPAQVGPVRIEADSGWVGETARLSLQVGAASPGAFRARGSFEDPFLAGKLDPPNPYAGQQAVWTLYLVTRGRAVRAEIKSLPDFRGFWAEDLDRDPDPSAQTWNVGGALWRAYPILRKAIFPSRAGRAVIEPATASVSVRGDIFDIFGDPFGEDQVVDRASAPLPVECRALPSGDGDLPVGSFSLKESLRPERLDSGDSATLSLTVSGDGRLSASESPDITVARVRVSPPETKLTLRRSGRLSSSRTWQWLLTPARSGSIELPPLKFRYFDPEAGKVRAEETSSRTLEVRVSAPVPPATPAPPSKSGPPPRAGSLRAPSRPAVVAAAAGAAIVLVLVGFLAGRRRGAPDVAPAGAAEDAGRLLDRLEEIAAGRSAAAREQVLDLRRRYEAALFAPQLASRDGEVREIEERIRDLARRWRA